MCEAQHVKALYMEHYKFNLQQHETGCCQDWIWKAWGFPDFQSLFWLTGNLCSSFPGYTFDQGFVIPVKCDVDELESTSSFRRDLIKVTVKFPNTIACYSITMAKTHA